MKGFKDSDGKFRPTEKSNNGVSRNSLEKDQHMNHPGNSKSKKQLKTENNPENIGTRGLINHHMFESSESWNDALAENPEWITPDENKYIFYIWFGGESHYIHEYTADGHEVDVFSCCFEKNKLDKNDVSRLIKQRLNED